MKAQFLAIAVVIAMFSGASHADSCAAGPFSNLIGTSCTIGDTTFTFSTDYYNAAYLPPLIFAPLVSSSSAGFEISGVPAADINGQPIIFSDYFTAVPSTFMITSFSATLNGVSATAFQTISVAYLMDGTTHQIANNLYLAGIEEERNTGGPLPSGFVGGRFEVDNASAVGSASFTSADFVFNESPTPEPATWLTFGTGLLGVLGIARRKFLSR